MRRRHLCRRCVRRAERGRRFDVAARSTRAGPAPPSSRSCAIAFGSNLRCCSSLLVAGLRRGGGFRSAFFCFEQLGDLICLGSSFGGFGGVLRGLAAASRRRAPTFGWFASAAAAAWADRSPRRLRLRGFGLWRAPPSAGPSARRGGGSGAAAGGGGSGGGSAACLGGSGVARRRGSGSRYALQRRRRAGVAPSPRDRAASASSLRLRRRFGARRRGLRLCVLSPFMIWLNC